MESQIIADMFSIRRGSLSIEQWKEVLKASDLLIQAMKKEGFETREIEYARQALL
jgi:hypothetical protein